MERVLPFPAEPLTIGRVWGRGSSCLPLSSHWVAHQAPLESSIPTVTYKAPTQRDAKTKQKDWNVGKRPVWRGEDGREDGETVIRRCYFKILLKKSVKNIKIVLSSSIFEVRFHRKILYVHNKKMVPRCVPSDCQEFVLYAIRSLTTYQRLP